MRYYSGMDSFQPKLNNGVNDAQRWKGGLSIE